LVTIWLALCGAFVYIYSSITRRAVYFVYLFIAALFWSEGALLNSLNTSIPTAVLTFVSTALVMNLIARFVKIEDLFTKPISQVATLIGWSICLWTIYVLLALMSSEAPELNWRLVA